MKSFLMIGQSNIAGRAPVGSIPPPDGKHIFVFRMGYFRPFGQPVNVDRMQPGFVSGIGFAEYFAEAFAEEYGEDVGLIPCADGGTAISQWLPGEILYDHAVFMAKLAMRTSELTGILWHQGEQDAPDESKVAAYEKRFLNMIGHMRSELGMPDIPVVTGELSALDRTGGRDVNQEKVNAILNKIAAENSNIAIAGSKGLELFDGIHFSAPSCREFGRRYFESYKSIAGG